MNMETIILYFFCFILALIIIAWIMPDKKKKNVSGFVKEILNLVPITAMIKAFSKRNDVNKNTS